MEFTIDKDTFVKALQKVQGIVEKRNTMPILSNVLIEAAEGNLYLTATDLEVGIKSSYATNVIGEGKITISAKKLYEIIKELPDEQVRFTTRDNDWVDIRCGKAMFNIVGLSPEEFPYFPQVREDSFISLSNSICREMIEKTSYAICNDETKYNLNGIFVRIQEEGASSTLCMVATDGHRLSIARKELKGTVSKELGKGAIFPKKGIFELKKMTEDEEGDILLGFMDNSAVIKKGNSTVVMRLVDGDFPDYTRVVPVSNDKLVRIDAIDFLHSLRRMAILSSEKFKGIKFEIKKGVMEISASNPEFGEAREEIEVDYEAEDITVRFNAKYLIDVLTVLEDGKVDLLLKDELSPCIMKPSGQEDFQAIVMPMRL